MTSTPWNPFRELEDLLDRYSRSVGRDYVSETDALALADWSPATDIREARDRFIITAELPGVPREDIDVNAVDRSLTISGEKRAYTPSGEGNRRGRTERVYGRFSRTFNLPGNADTGSIEARYVDGVLQIAIPKTEDTPGKKISVEVH